VPDSGTDGASNSAGCNSGTGFTSNVNVDSQSSGGGPVSVVPNLHNGCNDETLFTKPPIRDGMTSQVSFIFSCCVLIITPLHRELTNF